MTPTKKSVLILEDEKALRQVLVEKFNDAGFMVREAADGEAGLALARAALPDLILLDLLMPHMGGIEMMNRLNEANKSAQHIPVIILTNLDPGDRENKDFVANRPVWYFMKTDWTLEEIIQKAHFILGNGGDTRIRKA